MLSAGLAGSGTDAGLGGLPVKSGQARFLEIRRSDLAARAATDRQCSLLKQRLWRIHQRVLIGLASDLPKTEPADLEVIDARTMHVYRLVDVP